VFYFGRYIAACDVQGCVVIITVISSVVKYQASVFNSYFCIAAAGFKGMAGDIGGAVVLYGAIGAYRDLRVGGGYAYGCVAYSASITDKAAVFYFKRAEAV
jgi:hypothetical protein